MSVGATVLTGPRRTEAARRAGELEAARMDLGEVAAAIRVRRPPSHVLHCRQSLAISAKPRLKVWLDR